MRCAPVQPQGDERRRPDKPCTFSGANAPCPYSPGGRGFVLVAVPPGRTPRPRGSASVLACAWAAPAGRFFACSCLPRGIDWCLVSDGCRMLL
ncbi:unnamed protein product, partial [Amoebophrya sp. A120]|eukprot:GSA120T00000533001.1